MTAELMVRRRDVFEDGSFTEMKVSRLLEPIPPSVHKYKYSLVYIDAGRRVLGYDNERGKGDHRHEGEIEQRIEFSSMAALIEQFIEDVQQIRGGRTP